MKRIEIARRNATGGTAPTTDGITLLIGVSVEELFERWNPRTGASNLPADLQKRGQKRTRTAKDATNETDACSVIGFWALATWPGCRLDFDEQAGQLWAVIDE